MSRLEPNVEPSMEEILASIRKIIAEEPSGSRPAPPAPRPGAPAAAAPAAGPQRGFMSREAFLRSSAPPDPDDELPSKPVAPEAKPEPKPEPKAEAGPAAPNSNANSNPNPNPNSSLSIPRRDEDHASASGLSISADVPAKPSTDRNIDLAGGSKPKSERPTDAAGRPVADASPASSSASEKEARTASIDAQLADLLGDDLKALNGAGHVGKSAGSTAPASSSNANAISAPAAKSDDAEPRPGFTVSRVGFGNDAGDQADAGDPFAFDLGPSPFLSRPAGTSATEPQKPAPAAAPADHPKTDHPKKDVADDSRRPTNGTALPSITAPLPKLTVPVSTPLHYAQSAPSAAPVPAPAPRPSAPFTVPSVAATLGPYRTLEPLSSAFQPAPERQPPPQSSLPRPATTSPATSADQGRISTLRNEPAARNETRNEKSETSSLLTSYASDASFDRAIEDTVADLLRPMLRTWLAENMPKIVERALRREMTERLLPGQKQPLE